MTTTITARFLKLDQFGNPSFCCNNDNDSYDTLANMCLKMQGMQLGTFLPIFVGKDYVTIRFKSMPTGDVMMRNSVYNLTFVVKKYDSAERAKTYLSAHATAVELVEEAQDCIVDFAAM